MFASIVLFFELGDHRTLGSHEVFTAVPAREMLESGDWIVPTYGGLHRLRKPPLGYWVTASSSLLIGESSELSARLPSAVSALLLVGLVGWWAGRWYGARVGLWTAIVQTSSVFLVSYGRKSEVDMLLALLITAALCLIAHFDPADAWRRKFLIWFGLYALVGAAWMAKFHYGAAMVFGPGVVYLLVRGWRRSLWHPLNPAGLLVSTR